MAERPVRALLVVGETSGGIGRHVALLAERLGRHGVAAAVCGPASAREVVGPVPGVGFEVVQTSRLRLDAYVAARRRLRSLAHGFDVVHAHGLRAGAVAAARESQTPLVVTWHNAALVTGLRRRAHDALSRYVARSADLTLGASPDLTAAAQSAGATEARDTFVVAPPLAAPTRTRREVRAELGIGDRPVVLGVGRLQAQKRFDVLVAAAASWRGRPNGPVVLIAGDGPEREALSAQAAASGAALRLLGAREDVASLLGAADVVALPSAWEARALVAQEALRAGVPLVTTPVGGLPDLVGDAALMVPVGDPAALADAIERVLADHALAQTLAARGRRRAGDWPDVDAAVEDLAATYRSMLG